jgi:D-hexose-6-phosphate mutarotase
MDRVYRNTAATVTISDPLLGRRIFVAKENSNSTVVWNPWSDKVTTMADIPPADWPKFICVETCNVWDNQVKLAPGTSHTTVARISTEAI